MAIMLFRYLRRKYNEREVKKSSTTDDSHLVPEIIPSADNATATQTQIAQPVSAQKFAEAKEEERKRQKYVWRMLAGLILPNFLAAVDVTIVAPAIPIISSHFNHLSGSFNWIVAAYTLTFTTFVPATGQIAEIYGRHFALHFQVFWILIGSVLCAAAKTWGMLLLGRAIQGLGAAGIMTLSRIILSDGGSLADYSRNNTLLSLVSGVSYAVGPVLGGYLSKESWRYCFIVPIVVAALAHVMIFFLMRKDLVKGRAFLEHSDSRRTGFLAGLVTFDWLGSVLFILGVGLIILAIQWGGSEHPWSSAIVIAPLVVGAILFFGFFLNEYLHGPGRLLTRIFPSQTAMIPSTLFRQKDTSLLMVVQFSTGVSLVSAFYFISYYWQLAEGYSSSKAGVQLLYYTPGLGVGVYTAMFLCNSWPRQTYFTLLIGSIVEATGLAVLTWAVSSRHQTLVKVFLAVAGAGTGLRFMPVALHASGIWPTRIPAMQSLISFMIPFGETLGISTMASVFSNKLNLYLKGISASNGGIISSHGPPNIDKLNALPPVLKQEVQNAAARAVMWAFIAIMPIMLLSIIAAACMGNVWIGRQAKVEHGREAEKGQVLSSFYLYALCTGNVDKQKKDIDVHTEELREDEREKTESHLEDFRQA